MHQRGVTSSNVDPLYGSGDAFPGERLEIRYRQQVELFLFCCCQDGGGQRMLALSFQAGQCLQKPGLVDAFGGEDGADFRLALGEGSGLIDDQRVYFLHRFQGFRVADQDALPGAAAGAHHDGHGRGQAESAGAGNDEHSDRIHQGMRVPWLRAKHGPDGKGDHCRSQDRWDEVRSYPVGQPLDGGSAPLRLAYHFYDLGQECLGANALCFHYQAAGPVDRSTDHFVSGCFFYRDGLAGDHRFIDRAAPFGHHAIDGHLFSWANAQQIAYRDFADRDIGFVSVGGDTARGFGGQAKKRLDRAAGLAAGSQLQHLA